MSDNNYWKGVYNDDFDGKYLSARLRQDIRYDDRCWYIWNGKYWEPVCIDEVKVKVKNAFYQLPKLIDQFTENDKERSEFLRHCIPSVNVRSINRSIEAIQQEGTLKNRKGWNDNPLLLNCQNGIVDLAKGTMVDHDREYYFDRISPVTFVEGAYSKWWDDYINFAVDGDQELYRFIRQAVGLSITGLSVKALFFLYGVADSGKSSLIMVIRGILGKSYSAEIPIGNLLTRNKDSDRRLRTNAELYQKRFAHTTETPQISQLDISYVKDLTSGNDTIQAEEKYKSSFEFDPCLTLWMFGNKRPSYFPDTGTEARFRVIPFKKPIPKDKKLEKHDFEKMMNAELSGILNWAIVGINDYLENGLIIPESVKAESERYSRENDIIQLFLDECCIVDKSNSEARIRLDKLYEYFLDYCESEGEKTHLKRRYFRSQIEEKNYVYKKYTAGWFFEGITIDPNWVMKNYGQSVGQNVSNEPNFDFV